MKIGIDARLIDETGVGRYIRNLISELGAFDTTNQYVVFLSKKSFAAFDLPNARWKKVMADVHWHTVAEQLVMPKLFAAEKPDLIHIPYHNPPILYRGRIVITIHDLTILHFNTGKATTLPLPLYAIKRLGYWLELWVGLRKAAAIIAVSEVTKCEIVDHFGIAAHRIHVTLEGVDKKISHAVGQPKKVINDPYVLYVGNAYPHKNVGFLIDAFYAYVNHMRPGSRSKLVLVGSDDYFYRRLKKIVAASSFSEHVIFFGPADDAQLISLYANARAFVFPSLMEGFGLPALEALSLGCPVLVSDIPIFHEIVGAFATYFDPHNISDLATRLAAVFEGNSRPQTQPARALLDRYSWAKMAKETHDIYESSPGI